MFEHIAFIDITQFLRCYVYICFKGAGEWVRIFGINHTFCKKKSRLKKFYLYTIDNDNIWSSARFWNWFIYRNKRERAASGGRTRVHKPTLSSSSSTSCVVFILFSRHEKSLYLRKSHAKSACVSRIPLSPIFRDKQTRLSCCKAHASKRISWKFHYIIRLKILCSRKKCVIMQK